MKKTKTHKEPLLIPEEPSQFYKFLSETNEIAETLHNVINNVQPITSTQRDRKKCFNAISYIIMGLAMILVGIIGAVLFIYFEEIKFVLENNL